jgi:hypothetical protein
VFDAAFYLISDELKHLFGENREKSLVVAGVSLRGLFLSYIFQLELIQ